MLISMTGFGRGSVDAPFGRLIVEIQSVNRKYLEIFVSMPKEFSRYENEVRKWIGEAISRGQITVRIHLMPGAAAIEGLLPDVEMLRSLKQGWEKISSSLGYDPKKIDLNFIVQHLPSVQKIEFAKDNDLPLLQRCLDEALSALVQMKKKEGKALAEDIEKRLKMMEKIVPKIEELSPDASARMRQKLAEKIAEVSKAEVSKDDDDRIFREVAIFAERVDITEEITRLKSHFAQFKEMMGPKGGAIGRKMDFLVQEMAREINTVGSKSLDAKVSHLVVGLKSELEKIREQIQNIE
jgi:uncharacterized protein (TIGR00255 family)